MRRATDQIKLKYTDKAPVSKKMVKESGYRISEGTLLFSVGVILLILGFGMVELYRNFGLTFNSRELGEIGFLRIIGIVLVTLGIILVVFAGIITGYGYGIAVYDNE